MGHCLWHKHYTKLGLSLIILGNLKLVKANDEVKELTYQPLSQEEKERQVKETCEALAELMFEVWQSKRKSQNKNAEVEE